MRDIETFVALQANEVGPERLGEDLGHLGLAHAGFAFQEDRALELEGEEQRSGQPAVRDVPLGPEPALQIVDRSRDHRTYPARSAAAVTARCTQT